MLRRRSLTPRARRLFHPAWQEMMRLARRRRHRVELITNGLLLDAEVARALVDIGVAKVTVSVDGGDQAAYARMRGVPADGARAAVHHLLDARRHTRRPMAIGVAAVATSSTVASLPALLEWATDLRLDFVSIGNLVPHTEEMAGEILWERTGWASAFLRASWRPRLVIGRFDAEEATRPLATAVWERGLTYPSPSVDEGRWRNRCRFAHKGMCAVSWDGRVSPCLSLLHGHTEYINAQVRQVHEHVVGHIDEQPLAAIRRSASFGSVCARSTSAPAFTAEDAHSPRPTTRTVTGTRRLSAVSASGLRGSCSARRQLPRPKS